MFTSIKPNFSGEFLEKDQIWQVMAGNQTGHGETIVLPPCHLDQSESTRMPNAMRVKRSNLPIRTAIIPSKVVNRSASIRCQAERSRAANPQRNHLGSLLSPKVLVKGHAIYDAYRDAISNAKCEVLLQTYHWDRADGDPSPAQYIMDGLKDLEHRVKISRGDPVQVYFLVDEGPLLMPGGRSDANLQNLLADLEGLNLDPTLVQVHVAPWRHMALGSNHAKSLTVDGQMAIITGSNAQSDNMRSDGKEYLNAGWFDLGFVGFGAIASDQRRDFVEQWQQCAEPIPSIKAPINLALRRSYPKLDVCRRISTVGRHARDWPGGSMDSTQSAAFLQEIRRCRSVVKMRTPNLNVKEVMDALADAACRGVKVKLILSKGFNHLAENMPFQGGGNEVNAQRLKDQVMAKGGDEALQNLDMRWYASGAEEPVDDGAFFGRFSHSNRLQSSHAKYASFDHRAVIVGSTNMDHQSWYHSREFNWLVKDPSLARRWTKQAFDACFDRAKAFKI